MKTNTLSALLNWAHEISAIAQQVGLDADAKVLGENMSQLDAALKSEEGDDSSPIYNVKPEARGPMGNNILMWQASDARDLARLKEALRSATAPIQEALKWFEWEGARLTCGPKTLKEGKEHWRNLYFYLSGYGDAQFIYDSSTIRREPAAIPAGPAEFEEHDLITWLKLFPGSDFAVDDGGLSIAELKDGKPTGQFYELGGVPRPAAEEAS